MKKTLLTIASIALTVGAVAQKTMRPSSTNDVKANAVIKQNGLNTVATTCDTISTLMTSTLTVSTWGADATVTGCSPVAGYIFGTNCYGDLEKANFFPAATYSNINTPMASGVIVQFFKSGTRGTQGVATSTVGVKLYAGTSNTVSPGTQLGMTSQSMSQILASATSTNASFIHTFDFTSPVSIPSTGFFASIVLPTANGDTAVVLNNAGASVNLAWEKWSDGMWHSLAEFSVKGIMAIFPKVCGTVGLSENLGLSKDVTIFPNPTSGLVNVAVILAEKTNLTVTVSNTLGQTLVDNKYNGISNELLSLDLSNLNNGIYFVTVSNGKDKMVQRLVLNN